MKKYRLLFIIAALVSVQACAMEAEQNQEVSLEQVLERNGGDLTQALFDAAWHDRTETVIALINAGANVNTKGNHGCTPLHIAPFNNSHTETVIALIESGAKVNAKDHSGCTPLHEAAVSGHTATVIALIERGAKVNAKDHSGQTPLYKAAVTGQREMVIVLIEHGATVNVKSCREWTPLHLAAWQGGTETNIALIEHGADVRAKDNHGCTPLHWTGLTETAQALLLADQGKNKTDQQVQDSCNRIFELLLCLKNKAVLKDLQRKIMLQFTEDIFSAEMLANLLSIADQEQISQLIQHCPRKWFVQASKNLTGAIKDTIIQEITDHTIEQATEFCKIKSKKNKTAYDRTYHDKMKALLHPDDPEDKRAAFIRSQIEREFSQ